MKALQHTHLEINVPHILHNLNYYRSFLPPQTKMLVLVKAYAYGHGCGEFAKILERNGVDYLAVAFPREGVAIRHAGVQLPIIVLSGGEELFPLYLKYRLEPSIPTMKTFHRFVEEVEKAGKKDVPIHITLETGMHRLGFDRDQLDELIPHLSNPAIHVASLFSHFVAADDPAEDAFSFRQIEHFEESSTKLMQALPYTPMRHMLNSAGIERFATQAHYDMVRLGIGLYGKSCLDTANVRTTAYLRTPILQIKTVQQGETIGYNRAGKVPVGPITTATIAIGYADGISRLLGNGHASFMVNGHLTPTIGNICMDMCMLNVTGLDVHEGDMVTVFGDNPTICQLAEIQNAIPYEILSALAHRIPRIYKY